MSLRHITRENNAPYLDRYALRPQRKSDQDGAWRVFLHHFLDADEDGHHNHPWKWSFSVVLRGSYTEEILDVRTDRVETRQVRAGAINWIPSSKYHRIVSIRGDVWTLFFTGPKLQSWGFWMPGRGHVHWKERLRERGLMP